MQVEAVEVGALAALAGLPAALIGGAATLWGPLIAAVVFSLLAETLRLQLPQLYMMALGLLLILSVLYLPGGLASLRLRRWWATKGPA